MTLTSKTPTAATAALEDRYLAIRDQSLALCRTLQPEDCVVQTMPSVSPTKWHLAHTSWFFEQFILVPHAPGYQAFHPAFDYLFNSYYYTKGQMHPRDARGLLSRPTLREVRDYRACVDAAMRNLIDSDSSDELAFLVELGLHHEQQHQELILTDIKHVLSVNPLQPAYAELPLPPVSEAPAALGFVEFPGGIRQIGADGPGFCFDNETPRHRLLLEPFQLADRLVTNGEYREFIDAGGYADSRHWLADGWAWLQETGTGAPLYWSDDLASEFMLGGPRDIDPHAPVCHVNFYEADAFARWAGARLPSESEWESVATQHAIDGNTVDTGLLHPRALPADTQGIAQLYGDAWEWTASAYSPYPGFQPLEGSLGEYNGKFMSSQVVCRGGSCVTPADHLRATYRNFFYPQERWQFFGIRLARDVTRNP
ncbi:MAG: ergothioneine biosynthesis protein EgtB [Chromatiales bacterium]|nr:MAG: ergothioneine biosynthesis protein EgtB [Chromatiales bacterium]